MHSKLIGSIALVLVLVGCADKDEIAKLNADLEASRAETASARKSCDATSETLRSKEAELDRVKSELTKALAENAKLKQTARYFYDIGIEKMNAGATDANDEAAIAAFKTVVDRYPNDALAKEAAARIEEIKDRFDERAEAAARAQDKVRGFIKICQDNAQAAKVARDSGKAGAARAAKLDDAADRAKASAVDMIEKGLAPDDDHRLAIEADRCDKPE